MKFINNLANEDNKSQVHLLPCLQIEYQGKANKYDEDKDVITNSLYGRKLAGRKINLEEVKGAIYEKVDDNFVQKSIFTEYTVWGQQFQPSMSKGLCQLKDYCRGISALNQEVI